MMASSNLRGSWQCNKSVLERNRIMLERQINTDVTFVFQGKDGDGDDGQKRQTIGAHKYMLESSSPVFWSMFNGGLTEKTPITVTDVSYDTFGIILRYVYCEDLHLTGETVMQVLYASKKYIIPALTEICLVFLQENVDADNACVILDQALAFNEEKLIEDCMNIIKANTKAIFKSRDFLTISASCLERILQCDELSVPEIEVYQASAAWAASKCGGAGDVPGTELRRVLGNLLYKIRFPTMSLEEISTFVSPAGILSKDEEILCYRYIGNRDTVDVNDLPFTTQSRRFQDSNIQLLLPVQCSSYSLLDRQVGMAVEKRYVLYTTDVMNVVGFRVLCKMSDTVSLAFSEINEGQFRMAQQPQRQIILERVSESQGFKFAQAFARGRQCTLYNGKVQSTRKEHNAEFCDIYCEDKAMVMRPYVQYELQLSFQYAQSGSQQFIQAKKLVYRDVQDCSPLAYNPYASGYGMPQKAICIIGILVQSPN